MPRTLRLHDAASAVAIAILLLATAWIYHLGFIDSPNFDDFTNLGGLEKIDSLDSALAFIETPRGGPLGRPISMASFLLNAHSWPLNIEDFLYTNTCIHLLNGLLVIWLSYRLARHSWPKTSRKPELLALSAGALWLGHPLLLSASLLAVQRMTTLSATFIFAGLLLFVAGHEKLQSNQKLAFWQMTLGVGLGTMLAMLSKENGILLPVYALTLSLFILPKPAHPPTWYKYWQGALLIAPMLLLVGYFIANYHALILDGYKFRDFTLYERVISQPRALFEYLRLVIAPVRADLGPFHDDFEISKGLLHPLSTLLAIVFWVTVISTAFLLRSRHPAYSFAVFWFLGGHSIESTVFPLELYFEHRNYIPAFGPLYFVVFSAWKLIDKGTKFIFPLLVCYVVLIFFVLYEMADLWGKPLLAAELWHQQHPLSERAAQFLAREYLIRHQQEKAFEIIYTASLAHPEKIGLGMQAIQLRCGLGNEKEYFSELATTRLLQGNLKSVVCGAVRSVATMASESKCGTVSSEDILYVTNTLQRNREFGLHPSFAYCVKETESFLYERKRNLSYAVENLEQAFEIHPQTDDARRMAILLASAGLYDQALEKLDYAMTKKPRGFFAGKQWVEELNEAKKEIMGFKDASGVLQGEVK